MEGLELMSNTSLPRADFWKGRRVLISGHTGFKGSWLGLWLSELGANVTGVGLQPDKELNLFRQLRLEKRLCGHHIADIRKSQTLKDIVKTCKPEVVLHLAAQPLVRQSYVDPLGTWSTNVQGSLNLLEAVKPIENQCAVVMVTTDKVYANKEWVHGYRENDRLGGHDPYSASKAAAEIAIDSWRKSFCGQGVNQNPYLAIASARAGNVVGGGDWAENRIVPDTMRALSQGKTIKVRNPGASRPWQHVLEPLGGYLRLAEKLTEDTGSHKKYAEAFNFGPKLDANRTVEELVEEILKNWNGVWESSKNKDEPHEAGRLQLEISKAHHQLKWQPRWNFHTTIERTVKWYKDVESGADPVAKSLSDISAYQDNNNYEEETA